MASRPANRKLDSYTKVVVKNLNIYMKWTLIVWPLLQLKEATMKRSSIQHSFCHSLLSYHSSRTFFHHLFLQEHIFDSWEITVYIHTYVMYLQFKFKKYFTKLVCFLI